MIRHLARLLALLFVSLPLHALECPTGAVLKQTEAAGNTLHSWCEVDGKRQGAYEVFAVNGGLQLQAEYKDGKLDGAFKRFDSLGAVQTDGHYSRGQMDGVWTRYWSKDRIRDQGRWEKGVPAGEWRFIDAKTAAEKKISYGSNLSPLKSAPAKPKDLDDRWRYNVGFIHTERYGFYKPGRSGDDAYTVDLIGLDVERRVVQWKRYLRLDLTARLLPEKLPDNENVVLSAQAGISLDILRNLTNPVAFYMRMGPHFTDLDKSHFFIGLGLRYHLKRFSRGTHFSGFFAEIGHVDYESENQYQNTGPGGTTNNHGGDSGLDTFYTGVFWSAF